MLIITRHRDEAVYLKDGPGGELIGTITVADIRGDKVRLALDLPRSIHIDRHPTHNTKPATPREASS